MNDLNLSMFRANDIRTPVSRLTDDLALRLARAEAVYFKRVVGAPGVVVAHDARATGPRLLEMAVEEYRNAGLDVIVLPGATGACPLYYSAMRHPDFGAVLFGASHNPAGDTGRKMLAPELEPIAEGIGPSGGLRCLRELYVEGARDQSDLRGRLIPFDAVPGYVNYSLIQAQVDPGGLRDMRILHDYLYGAGGRELMLGFQPTGALLEPLHFAADGMFRLGDPNPVKQDVIAPGLQYLACGRYSLGMFFDGDADRLDLYLGDGAYLAASFMYAAILPFILRRRKRPSPRVLVDTKANPLAALEMARTGARVGLVANGHSLIKHTMRNHPDILGTVEESAHFYEDFELEGWRYCTENTLYFALLAARVARESPDRFRDMLRLQSSTFRARDWGHRFPSDIDRKEALAAVVEHFTARGAAWLDRLPDGTSLHSDMLRMGIPFELTPETVVPDAWLQVSQRPSQSEDGLARWEVVGAPRELVEDAKAAILQIAANHRGGPEYRG